MRLPLLPIAILVGLSAIHCSAAHADSPSPCTAVGAPACPPSAPAAAAPRVEVVGDESGALPTFRQGGRIYVLGESGERYRLHLVNPTAGDVEAVVSVDGLDAVDGKPASLAKRGYIVPAFGDLTVDGWRTSLEAVAAFRFGSVRGSYAARAGHARNVGVIGVAFFREHVVAPPPPVVYGPPASAAPTPEGRREIDDSSRDVPSNPPRASSAGSAGGAAAESGSQRTAPEKSARAQARPGLGTEFGEAHESHVTETSFTRADPQPMLVAEVRYDDRQGLLSRGIVLSPPPDPRQEENARRDTAQPFPVTRFAQPPL